MDDQLFQNLCEGVREAGAISRGDKQPAREWRFEKVDGYDRSIRTLVTDNSAGIVPGAGERDWEH